MEQPNNAYDHKRKEDRKKKVMPKKKSSITFKPVVKMKKKDTIKNALGGNLIDKNVAI